MTKSQSIEEACSIVSLAYQSIGNHDYPSDCFCGLAIGNPTYNNYEVLAKEQES